VINGFWIGAEEGHALQLTILHTTSAIHAVCLNLDVENVGLDITRRKGKSDIHLSRLQFTVSDDFTVEFNRLVFRPTLEKGEPVRGSVTETRRKLREKRELYATAFACIKLDMKLLPQLS